MASREDFPFGRFWDLPVSESNIATAPKACTVLLGKIAVNDCGIWLNIVHHEVRIDIRQRLDHIIAKHTKQDYEKVRTDTERDYFMSSEEAVKYGIIDRVITEH